MGRGEGGSGGGSPTPQNSKNKKKLLRTFEREVNDSMRYARGPHGMQGHTQSWT